jgi:methylmalonyl-CoA mutase cobalamin-binding domain/chain
MMPTPAPLRLLTAVPLCDGHDSAITTINLEFIRRGIEVVYLGFHRSARDIVRAAIQEDVRAIGISSYNGGHVEFFHQVLRLLKQHGGPDIGVFGGGGGTITATDAARMRRFGVGPIFFPGTPLDQIVATVLRTYRRPRPSRTPATTTNARVFDRTLARQLTGAISTRISPRQAHPTDTPHPALILGITGPGGAGKTTLIDELVLRFLHHHPTARLAILSHDPSLVDSGALLGDRATMIYSQDDRVFMRSLSTRGTAGGLAAESAGALALLTAARVAPDGHGFDLILIETVGIGQEAQPFAATSPSLPRIAKTLYITSPEYGSPLQLHKIAMLDRADLIIVNKADLPGAKTACAELELRLAANRRGQLVLPTIAKQHADPGVDRLFTLLTAEAGGPA